MSRARPSARSRRSSDSRNARAERGASDADASSTLPHEELLELAQLLVIALDADGKIVAVNEELARVTGWSEDELMSRSCADLCVHAVESRGLAAAREAIRAGTRESVDVDVELASRAGSVRLVRMRLAKAPAGLSRATVYAIGRDITDERARAESAYHGQRLAAIGTLAAGLAHEIRNPLHGALLHLRVLERAMRGVGVPAAAHDALGTIELEIKRLSTLVDEFLDFARPRPLSRERVGIAALFEHCVARVEADAQRAQVAITLTLPLGDLSVEADREKLACVIENLLTNAIESIAAARPRGHVELRARREPGRICIEVEDDGPGLRSPREPIFDVFYSTKAGGTGLGLPLAHRIVSDHGGELVVDGGPGATTFRVLLPPDAPR